MSFCEEKLIKLNNRMDQPLPTYTKEQINRTSKIQIDTDLLPQIELRAVKKEAKQASYAFISQNISNEKMVKKMSTGQKPVRNPMAMERNSKTDRKNEEDQQDKREAIKERRKIESKGLPIDKDEGPFEDFFKKREKPDKETPFDRSQGEKRIKSQSQGDSKFGSPLINVEEVQKNKITDYFNFNQNNVDYSDSSDFLLNVSMTKNGKKDRSTENDSKSRKLSDKDIKTMKEEEKKQMKVRLGFRSREEMSKLEAYEKIMKDKDKEIARLHRQLDKRENEKSSYKKKVCSKISKMVLELEYHKKHQKKSYINNQKLRIGEFVPYREGAKYVDIWIDGIEMRDLKIQLAELAKEKEMIEKIKKQVKRKKSKSNNNEEKIANEVSDYSNSNILDIAQYRKHMAQLNLKNQDMLNLEEYGQILGGNQNLNDLKERINYQLQFLTKKENRVKEQIEMLKREKEKYISILNGIYEEENSRFGRINQKDKSKMWPLLSDKYQILSLLGKGGFSEVYKAYDCEHMCFVACKIHQLSPNWSESVKSNYIRHALRENQVLKVLNHPNIIRHYDSVEIDSNSFCTVLEYCSGPDLANYLKSQKTLSEKEAKLIIKQLLSALKFLNENDKKIIHYDLKPQNIMYHQGLIKISDFGLCKIMDEGETKVELTSQGVGTYWYLPPECFDSNYPKISTKVDVWSVGVIFFEILYGFRPFGHNMSQERILKEGYMLNVKEVDFPTKPVISSETKEFIKKSLEYYQEQRLDIIEAFDLISKL